MFHVGWRHKKQRVAYLKGLATILCYSLTDYNVDNLRTYEAFTVGAHAVLTILHGYLGLQFGHDRFGLLGTNLHTKPVYTRLIVIEGIAFIGDAGN